MQITYHLGDSATHGLFPIINVHSFPSRTRGTISISLASQPHEVQIQVQKSCSGGLEMFALVRVGGNFGYPRNWDRGGVGWEEGLKEVVCEFETRERRYCYVQIV